MLAAGLVGCTPPMPPEVKAALADKYVTCVDGPLTISSQPEFEELLNIWSESYTTNCANSKLQIVGKYKHTNKQLCKSSSVNCFNKPFLPVPNLKLPPKQLASHRNWKLNVLVA